MTVESDVKDIINADSTLTGLLTGGIYTYDETGRLGISRQTTPSAFSGATIKPNLVIWNDGGSASFDIIQEYPFTASTTEIVQLRFRSSETNAITTLTSAMNRARQLLHGARLSGGGHLYWFDDITMPIEQDLLRAKLFIQTYHLQVVRS